MYFIQLGLKQFASSLRSKIKSVELLTAKGFFGFFLSMCCDKQCCYMVELSGTSGIVCGSK